MGGHAFCLVKPAKHSGFYIIYRPEEPGTKERKIEMALTRKMLKAMGIEDDKIDQIIEAHSETVDGLKTDLKKYEEDAKVLPDIRKQLEKAQADLEAGKKDSYKVKYDALKEDFEKFKNEQTQKENHEAKESAYRGILKAAGISEKRIDAILKVSDIDSLEIEDGKIKDAEKLTENAKKEWADFVVVETTNGVKTPNPPANNPIPAEPKNLADALRVKYEKG
nr:MAG TPA: minor structural protein [Caudoviricetes sp.]